MDAASVFLGSELLKRIKEQRSARVAVLINGQAQDYADYRDRAGYLRALADIEKWMTEINAREEAHGPFGQDADHTSRRPQGRHLA